MPEPLSTLFDQPPEPETRPLSSLFEEERSVASPGLGRTGPGSRSLSTLFEIPTPSPAPALWDVVRTGEYLSRTFGLEVTSNIRTPEKNVEVGGVPNSLHLTGQALDLSGPPENMRRLANWARTQRGPGLLFSEVIHNDTDHSDHVHLGFNPEVQRQIRKGEYSFSDPWLQGVSNLFSGGANLVRFAADVANGIRDAIANFIGVDIPPALLAATGHPLLVGGTPFQDKAEELLRREAQSFARPIPEEFQGLPNELMGFVDPKRINAVVGQFLPMTMGLVTVYAFNPIAGLALTFGIESGSLNEELKQYSDEEISPTERLIASSAGGAFNAGLELTGLGRILNVGRATGVKSALFKLLVSTFTEGTTESLQEIPSLLAEYGIEKKVPEDVLERFVETFYAGTLLGMAGGGVSGALSLLSPNETVDSPLQAARIQLRTTPQEEAHFIDIQGRPVGSKKQFGSFREVVTNIVETSGDTEIDLNRPFSPYTKVGLIRKTETAEGLKYIVNSKDISLEDAIKAVRQNTVDTDFEGKIEISYPGLGIKDVTDTITSKRELPSPGFDSKKLSRLADIMRPLKSSDFGNIGLLFRKFLGKLDTPYPWERAGFKRTGSAMKRLFSIMGMYENHAKFYLSRISKQLKGDAKRIKEAFTIAESGTEIEELMTAETRDESMIKAVELIRDWLDGVQGDLKGLGYNADWSQDLLGLIETQIDYLINSKDAIKRVIRERGTKKGKPKDVVEQEITDALNKLADRIQNLRTQAVRAEGGEFKFVPLPSMAFIHSAILNAPEDLVKAFEGLQKKRGDKIRQLRLRDFEEAGMEIDIPQMMLDYSRSAGRRAAFLTLRQAAELDGIAVRRPKVDDRLTEARKDLGLVPSPLRRSDHFKEIFGEYEMVRPMSHWLTNFATSQALNPFQKTVNTTKMMAFWNPLFLGVYDIVQASMVNAGLPFLSPKSFRAAWKDIRELTPNFLEAEKFGLSSQPFSSPLKRSQQEFQAAMEGPLKNFLKDSFGQTTNVLKASTHLTRNIYQTSWDTAWFLDRFVRQITYNWAKETKGMSPQEAAEFAATVHADYGAVPVGTRRFLNTIFFTPTFKIAMGKFFVRALQGMGAVFEGTATIPQRTAAQAIGGALGIMVAMDMFMLSLGFERDEFGRKYVKTDQTEFGPKEIVITWSAPHNLWLKYAQRFKTAMIEPQSFENRLGTLVNSFKWEVQPLFRAVIETAENKGTANRRIYWEFDDAHLKVIKSLQHLGTSIVQILALLGPPIQDPEQAFGEKGRQIIRDKILEGNVPEETQRVLSSILGSLAFVYQRDPTMVRHVREIEKGFRIFEENIGARGLIGRLSNAVDSGEEMKKLVRDIPMFTRNFVELMDDLINEVEKSTYGYEASSVRLQNLPQRPLSSLF